VLDAIPGITVGLTIIFCIAAAVSFPQTLLFIAALLALYSALRFLLAGIANVHGLKYIEAAEATDWRALYTKRAGPGALPWDVVHHVVIIPNYKESHEVLEKTLQNIAGMCDISRNMSIVLAMEEAEEGCVEKAEKLQASFAQYFKNVFYTVHPAGLPGELQCKSANLAWAGRWVKQTLVDEAGIDISHIIVTSMDSDTMWHQDYFTALTYYFAIDLNRHKRFWQAPIRYHSNVYQVNPLIRLVNAYSTAIELAYLAAPWWPSMPISSYSLSLRLLDDTDYWDTDVIADEWHMYIKAFFRQQGETKLVPIYLPFLATSVTGDTFWQLCKNRYQQSLRHAWGSKEIGYTVGNMLRNPHLSSLDSFRLLVSVAHDILLSGAGWVLMIMGANLPLLLHPALLASIFDRRWEHPSLIIFQVAFAVFFLLGVVFWFLDVSVRPPRQTPVTWREGLLTTFGFLLLPLLTVAFVTLPILHAQTWLLAGIPLLFRVTSKL
jgi:hypothetical protein